MDSREGVLAALDHIEADRVPREFAGTRYSSMRAEAYKRVRPVVGLPDQEIHIVDTTQGLAGIHEDMLQRLGADVGLINAGAPYGGEYERFLDDFGVPRARGAIRELIPDLIDIGVDALDPVQVSAEGMDTAGLKAEFGDDITFSGGTVDPQKTLARGTPEEVHDETVRRINGLKPGGGFVIASVHNMQAQVPVENILAVWDAVEEAGTYA